MGNGEVKRTIRIISWAVLALTLGFLAWQIVEMHIQAFQGDVTLRFFLGFFYFIGAFILIANVVAWAFGVDS